MLVNNENEIVNFMKKDKNNNKRFENNFDDQFLLNISNALNEINLIDESTIMSSNSKITKRNSGIIIISNREDENKLSIINEISNNINF